MIDEQFRRKGGRVVEGAALEKQYTGNGIVGSNPTPSAFTFINNPRDDHSEKS